MKTWAVGSICAVQLQYALVLLMAEQAGRQVTLIGLQAALDHYMHTIAAEDTPGSGRKDLLTGTTSRQAPPCHINLHRRAHVLPSTHEIYLKHHDRSHAARTS